MALLDSLTWFTLTFLVARILWSTFRSRQPSKLGPPGPPGWPLIETYSTSEWSLIGFPQTPIKLRPVLWLKLGSLNTLVIQSAAAAAELSKNHDLVFSDRKVPDSMTACDYHEGTLAFAAYDERWRVLRRLSSSELTTRERINSSITIRKKCIEKMVEWIKEDASISGEIELDKYLLIMSFNLVSNTMLSRDIMEMKSEMGSKFFVGMNKFISWQGRANVVDSFEWLKWIDPPRIRRNTERHMRQLLDLISGFVEERIRDKKQGRKTETRDFLDALLEYQGNGEGATPEISDKNVTIIILEMFFGGTETTSNTTQWGMTELLRHPDSMKKLKTELDQVVGHSRTVEEGDLNELPYLQAVVKETMRLHPALPLLLPRKARQETKFKGYNIPKDTMAIANVWAIHRDPDSWEDPSSFKPERFLNSDIDYKGQHYELIPFGSGRRSCLGMLMGERTVGLTLARLIQSFDWDLPENVSPENLDMREMKGMSIRMLVPLKEFQENEKPDASAKLDLK